MLFSSCQPLMLALIIGVMISLFAVAQSIVPPDEPEERTDENSRIAHAQLVEKARQGSIDLYFIGDSITRRWGATDYPEFLEHWRKTFFGWNAANFGWGGDRTQNILWRLQHGELDGIQAKVFVILAGTNNLRPGMDLEAVAEVARGVAAIIQCCRSAIPDARVILVSVFPRSDFEEGPELVKRLNEHLRSIATENHATFLDVHASLVDDQGKPRTELFPDRLHPSLAGYEIWAAALLPVLEAHLGPKANEDHAPPPTGDPRALGR